MDKGTMIVFVRTPLITMLCLLSLIAGAVGFARTEARQESSRLFSEARGTLPDSPLLPALRTRSVRVDVGMLRRSATARGSLALNLFDDTLLSASLKEINTDFEEGFTWVGSVDGAAFSTVIFSIVNEAVSGTISTSDALYEVRYAGEGLHTIRQLDLTNLPPDDDGGIVPGDEVATNQYSLGRKSSDVMQDRDDAKIRLLFLYTKNAKKEVGGKDAVVALLQQSFEQIRQGMEDSMTKATVVLAGIKKIRGTESPDGTLEFDALVDPEDSNFDKAPKQRKKRKADYVGLYRSGDPFVVGRCGRGYRWADRNAASAFAPRAYHMVLVACVGQFTGPHEFGHNMGGCHAEQECDLFSFARGYFILGNFRTIMATSTECARRCPRILMYSHKKKEHAGVKIGDRDHRFAIAIKRVRKKLARMFESL